MLLLFSICVASYFPGSLIFRPEAPYDQLFKNSEEDDNLHLVTDIMRLLLCKNSELESNGINLKTKEWLDALYTILGRRRNSEEDDNSWQSVLGAFLGGFFGSKAEPESNAGDYELIKRYPWLYSIWRTATPKPNIGLPRPRLIGKHGKYLKHKIFKFTALIFF